MTAKRILTDDGSFVPFNQVKKEIEEKAKVAEAKQEEVVVSSEEVEVKSNKITLSGDETASELKAFLDGYKVKYPKTANKDMLKQLLAPYLLDKNLDETIL